MSEMTDSDDKLITAMAYWGSILLCIPTLIIFMLKKDESIYIRKHALQALLLGLFACVVFLIAFPIVIKIFSMLTFGVGGLFVMLVEVIIWLLWLGYIMFLGIQVFQGQDPEVPYVSEIIRNNLTR